MFFPKNDWDKKRLWAWAKHFIARARRAHSDHWVLLHYDNLRTHVSAGAKYVYLVRKRIFIFFTCTNYGICSSYGCKSRKVT